MASISPANSLRRSGGFLPSSGSRKFLLDPPDPFGGRKMRRDDILIRRRPSKAERALLSGASLPSGAPVVKVWHQVLTIFLSDINPNEATFVSHIAKFGTSGFPGNRVLVLTSEALHVLSSRQNRCLLRVPLSAIAYARVTPFWDDVCCLALPVCSLFLSFLFLVLSFRSADGQECQAGIPDLVFVCTTSSALFIQLKALLPNLDIEITSNIYFKVRDGSVQCMQFECLNPMGTAPWLTPSFSRPSSQNCLLFQATPRRASTCI